MGVVKPRSPLDGAGEAGTVGEEAGSGASVEGSLAPGEVAADGASSCGGVAADGSAVAATSEVESREPTNTAMTAMTATAATTANQGRTPCRRRVGGVLSSSRRTQGARGGSVGASEAAGPDGTGFQGLPVAAAPERDPGGGTAADPPALVNETLGGGPAAAPLGPVGRPIPETPGPGTTLC